MARNSKLIIILVLVILGEFLFTFHTKIGPIKIKDFADKSKITNDLLKIDSITLKEKRRYWEEYIDEVGPEQAYKDFKTIYEPVLSPGVQHNMAHLIGELLFQKKGIDGFTICESTFAFGCYHGFFSAAVYERGLEITPQLDKACIKKYGLKGLGCPHGIGHGVISYLGDKNLLEALDICSKLSWKGPIGGCTSGVFMEYNLPTMGDRSTRALDKTDIRAPCSKLPQKYLQACYFEQAAWWERVFNKDYIQIGKMCNDIEDRVNREACLHGLGQVVGPSSSFNVKKSIAVCEQMPNEKAKLLCREGAAWSFFAEPQYKDKASALCDNLDQNSKYICVDHTDMFKDKIL